MKSGKKLAGHDHGSLLRHSLARVPLGRQMPQTTNNYGIGARDYLERSRQQLELGTSATLFYAAFELRCGIEARMQQYLDDQQQIERRLREGWRIAHLRRGLERAFGPGGERIVAITVESGEIASPVSLKTFFYTPVGRDLQNGAERLGEYLHSMRQPRAPDDSWWKDTRVFIEAIHKGLEQACLGTLIGPPLRSEHGQLEMRVEVVGGTEYAEALLANYVPGLQARLRVEYLDEFPGS